MTEVFDFGQAIEKLNKQPREFWLKYAGETLYVHFPNAKVVYRSMDFSAVSAFAAKHPDSNAMIVPVPSGEQIKKKFARKHKK